MVVTGTSMVDEYATTAMGRETVDRTRAKMRFGSVNMHLTKKKKRRELVYLIEHWIKADICGIAETWIKDGGEELTAELKDSELA